MVIFRQSNFVDGLNRELDEAKIPRSAYPLLINGRTRRNVVAPTNKHNRIAGPSGTYQGLYVAGNYLILFCSGLAYYATINEDPIVFKPLDGWTPLDTTTPRIYAELVAATTNFFNRASFVDDIDPSTSSQTVFNNTIAASPQALFVFDGINRPNYILPSGATGVLKDYGTWTKDAPEYVPVGKLPAALNGKLFLASPDGTKIFHSVSGRMSDFVINIDADGFRGGDASTVATSVSYNELTSLRALSSGQLLATTLYASYVVTLDYDNPFFGEPYLQPSPLFPVGCVNDLSTIDVIVNNLQDTAFITQSGIQSFNVVSQLNVESNNLPFGAKIQGLLANPQQDTCTVNFDDYSFFGVNTIYGYGAIVYDNVRQNFQSLDLSFRHAKQFAVTKLDGRQRLFFITYTNEIFEAFAASEKDTARLYLGDWTPDEASKDALVRMIDLTFTEVKSSGHVKVSIYSDKEFVESRTFVVTVDGYTDQAPIPFPFTTAKTVSTVNFQLSKALKCWKLSVAVEWNFDGNLSDISADGEFEQSDNVELKVQNVVTPDQFAFFGCSGYGAELNPGGTFANGIVTVPVTKGQRYVYYRGDDGKLVTGKTVINSGLFTANQDNVAVAGTTGEVPDFSLRLAENFASVMTAVRAAKIPMIIGGGDHAYPSGTSRDCVLMQLGFDVQTLLSPGEVDLTTSTGKAFYASIVKPRYYTRVVGNVEFFFYNSNGVVNAAYEPDGYDEDSAQFSWLKYKLQTSTAKFKIVVMHHPPYTTDDTNYPGYTALRLPFAAAGAHAVLSAHTQGMERIIVDGFPYFVCGTGGKGLTTFRAGVPNLASFRQASDYGFLHITADPVSCVLTFKDTSLNELDSYTLYP